jgi:hypothetical protein
MLAGQVVEVNVVNTFRGLNDRGHGDTPSRRIFLIRAGLPLAEQPVCRHWCGVEGETVLNPKLIISEGDSKVSLDKRKTHCFHG